MPLPETTEMITAVTLGLLGSAHCMGMCGGITTALGASMPADNRRLKTMLLLMLPYNIGRISSYAMIGSIAGSFGWLAATASPALGLGLHYFAAIMLVAMGLYIGGWWRILTRLEQVGGTLWKRLQPFASKLLPVKSPWQALCLGILWGWLPCGLVYSTLIWSAAAADGVVAGILMGLFGLGTLPSLLLTGLFAGQLTTLIQQRYFRTMAGLLIIACGIWTLPGIHSLLILTT